MKPSTRVKICCIASIEEARTAVAMGASALGLVAAMPSGPGVIPEATIAEIAKQIPPPIATFLLTSEVTVDGIVAQQRTCGTNTIQLCDYVEPSVYRELRRELPGIAIVQVIHVTGPGAIEIAVNAEANVHALLLDSGNTSLPVKRLGGTGQQHDWSVSRRIRETVRVPVFLAGGLNAANIVEAVACVEPFGVDVCTGVRIDGRLSKEKLHGFFGALSRAE
ncbi:MAG: phosphoribosylanthranilate isomerase [Pirellula sp.]